MNAGVVSGVVTGVLLMLFLGGWAWAWSGRRREHFEAASRLPLVNDLPEQRP